MNGRIREHLFSLLLVTILLGSLIVIVQKNGSDDEHRDSSVQNPFVPSIVNLDSDLERSILIDVLTLYYPEKYAEHRATVEKAADEQSRMFARSLSGNDKATVLTLPLFWKILVMFLKFVFVYCAVMMLTYYGVLTAGTWRFIRRAAKKEEQIRNYGSTKMTGLQWIKWGGGKFLKFAIHMVLFSPAFVIAYSMKTELNTDSVFFMVLLGVISNGLLVIYTNKFYSFLMAESRKGYVDTAIVKNLHRTWVFNADNGIRLSAVFKPSKNFRGHIFDHIYENALIQYISTIKEQSAFLITGLIIIEMALNIHGYLNYEMLKQILYGNVPAVLLIILLLFYIAKISEAAADILLDFQLRKYRNANE